MMLMGFCSALFLSTYAAYIVFRSFLHSLGFSFTSIIGLSYFLGLGIITQSFMWLWIWGAPVSYQNILIILICLSVIGFLCRHRFTPLDVAKEREPVLRYERFFIWGVILYVSYNLILVVLSAASIPVFSWDSITSEAYKAKTVFYTGSLLQISHAFYPNFPFYTLSAMAWTMFGQGLWDDQYIHLIFAFSFLAFTFIFYDIARQFTSKVAGLFSLFLLYSSNLLIIHATLSYRDVLMMAHTSLCVFGILLWGGKGKDGLISFSAVFAGLSLLTKLEGLPYYPVYLIMLIMSGVFYSKTAKDIFKSLGQFIFISGIVYLPFQIYKVVVSAGDNGWVNNPVLGNEGVILRFCFVIQRFFNELFLSGNWNIFFWPLAVISVMILLIVHRKDPLGKLFFMSIILFFGVYLTTYVFTGVYRGVKTPYTISRYFLHFFPLVILMISRVGYLIYGSQKRNTI
ncbi:MAG: glycosyltransferase family 39 protein [Candidatus Omnitrophica bacterium]|nr:glycosyltransferase family 39 protein [Candidatus Omnitrophota bacterium]